MVVDHEDSKALVIKFGGTSVGDAAAIRQATSVVQELRRDWPRIVVVTSAMAGVTNLLIATVRKALEGKNGEFISAAEAELRAQHHAAIGQLLHDPTIRQQVEGEVNALLGDFVSLSQAIAVLGEATPRAMDAVTSLGERLSSRILAAAVRTSGIPAIPIDATRLIVTDDCYQSAHPDFPATTRRTREELSPIFAQGAVPVITGFIAATRNGITTTLGRGGSDYSAAIIGAALPAQEVWIYTDVDGVMTADPRLVSNARSILELSYREIAELAYYGAKVVHPKTIRPVIEAGIGLRVCNTFNPGHPGTRLVADRNGIKDGTVKAVTAIRQQSLITVEGRGMLGVPGVAARAFGAVAATGTSVPLITQASSEQSICFAVPYESAEQVVAALDTAFTSELRSRDIDTIWASPEVTIITAVGAGMRNTPGIAGRLFTALGEQNVNVIAIAQGSSEVSISVVVEAADAERGVRAIHAMIEGGWHAK